MSTNPLPTTWHEVCLTLPKVVRHGVEGVEVFEVFYAPCSKCAEEGVTNWGGKYWEDFDAILCRPCGESTRWDYF